jgi:hypothetical protein
MTTTVTVETHDRPVMVSSFAMKDGKQVEGAKWKNIVEMKPHSKQVFHPHSEMDILIQEYPINREEIL